MFLLRLYSLIFQLYFRYFIFPSIFLLGTPKRLIVDVENSEWTSSNENWESDEWVQVKNSILVPSNSFYFITFVPILICKRIKSVVPHFYLRNVIIFLIFHLIYIGIK